MKVSNAITEMASALKQITEQTQGIFKNIVKNDDDIEIVRPMFVADEFKSAFELQSVYRFNQSGLRYYFTAEEGKVEFYPSVTTIISKTTPMSYGLQTLLAEKGMSGYRQFMREKAMYGTFLHILIADYLRSGKTKDARHFDFDDIQGRVELYREENYINFSTSDWTWNAKKDLASLIQFCYDYDVEPIAIEAVGVFNDGNVRYAGAIDLICNLTIKEKGFYGEVYKSGEKKGEPKESYELRKVTALIDFKSGKSGFFDDHSIQLAMYKSMAEEAFGLKIDKLYNVSPKDWTGEVPTYSIKDQTDDELHGKIPYMLGQFMVEWREPKDIQVITGKVNGAGLDSAVKFVPAAEFALNKVNAIKAKNNNINNLF